MTRNPLDRLASLGEEVLGKASQNPTAARVLQSAMQLKDRVDDLSKRVRGLEAMEKRLAKLEKRLGKLEYDAKKKPAPSARKPAAPRKSAPPKK
jgi:3-methyladenine DNA glycosylase/8-oxoguanine DNA glycosylase